VKVVLVFRVHHQEKQNYNKHEKIFSTRHIQRLIEYCQFYSNACDKSKSAIGGHCVYMSCAVQGCPSITASRVYYVGEQCQAVITSANHFAFANAVRKTFAYHVLGRRV
jgi:hypothetical protein